MRHPSAAGKFLRFVLVGSICAALYFSICYVLKAGLAWSAFSSALVAYLVCFALGYAGHKNLVFGSRSGHARSLPRYALLQIMVAVFTAASTEWAAVLMDLNPLHVSVFATVLAGTVSFFVSYFWVFREPSMPR
jgi:putative flippase GtrA